MLKIIMLLLHLRIKIDFINISYPLNFKELNQWSPIIFFMGPFQKNFQFSQLRKLKPPHLNSIHCQLLYYPKLPALLIKYFSLKSFVIFQAKQKVHQLNKVLKYQINSFLKDF